MTEDEAKTKWCPFATTRLITSVGQTASDRCIGSACMAWRWGIQHPGGGYIQFMPREAMTPEEIADPKNKLGGYCGLAGKP